MSDLNFLQLVQQHLAERGRPLEIIAKLRQTDAYAFAATRHRAGDSERLIKMHLDKAIIEMEGD